MTRSDDDNDDDDGDDEEENNGEIINSLLFLFHCRLVQPFWKDFEYYFYLLTREFVHLTLHDIMIGIIYAKYRLPNYLILVAKLYIWDCRGNLTPPIINAFKRKVNLKYETETFICVKSNYMDKFNKKWDLCMGSVH